MDILGKLSGVFSSKEQKLFSEQANAYDFMVNVRDVYYFKALKVADEKVLLVLLDKYKLKQQDRIVDESNISYFVKDVDLNYQHKINGISMKVQKVIYDEKPLELPNYVMQNAKIESQINISGSSIAGDIGTYVINQNIGFAQILKDIEDVAERSYYIEEMRKDIKEIKELIAKKQPIGESKFKRICKGLGTFGFELAKAFIAAYAATLALQ